MHPLIPPAEIKDCKDRSEYLRCWIDGGKLSTTLTHSFFDEAKTTLERENGWAMYLSDIAHHVSDALSEDSGHPRSFVIQEIRNHLKSIQASERGCGSGLIKLIHEAAVELPVETIHNDEQVFEIVRIFKVGNLIKILLKPSLWSELGGAEENWASVLYDLSYQIAASMNSKEDVEISKWRLVEKVIEYIENPTTEYSGNRYSHE